MSLLAIFSCLSHNHRWGKKPRVALRGKVVWLTGASSGIGEHLAYALASNGAKLVLSSRREKELQRVLQNCKGSACVAPLTDLP